MLNNPSVGDDFLDRRSEHNLGATYPHRLWFGTGPLHRKGFSKLGQQVPHLRCR